MWIVDVGKKPMIIQCSNYECMCKFAIVKEEIRTSHKGINYIKCPVCGKEIRLIYVEEEV